MTRRRRKLQICLRACALIRAEAEANAHARALAELEVAREGSALAAVNKTIQAEVASADPYVRRMRPTFGYLMAMTWAAQMFGLAYVIFVQPDRAGDVMAGMAHLTGHLGALASSINAARRNARRSSGYHHPFVLRVLVVGIRQNV